MFKFFSILILLLTLHNLIAQPTYTQDIKPIIKQKCLPCHNGHTSAPFNFTSFENIKDRSATIQYVVENKIMPIWKADPSFSHFDNEIYLNDLEIQSIRAWCKAQCPKGKGNPDFSPKELKQSVPSPDYTLHTESPIVIYPSKEDIFGIIKIPFEFDQAFDVKSIVFKNTQEKQMHHVSIFILETPDNPSPDPTQAPAYYMLPPLDQDTLAGKVFNLYNYLNILPKDQYEYWHLLRYKTHSQPGKSPTIFPQGMGFKMPKKGIILLDMIHYLPTTKQLLDNISIEIYKQNQAIDRFCLSTSIGIGNPNSTGEPIVIMPNQQRWLSSETTLPADMSLFEITPHIHLIGTQFRAIAISPQSDTIPLIRINNWDMAWQETYRFNPLLKLPQNTRIRIEAFYDNTANNPKNPNNPPKIIQQSMNKQDEMLLLILNFFPYQANDEKQKYH